MHRKMCLYLQQRGHFRGKTTSCTVLSPQKKPRFVNMGNLWPLQDDLENSTDHPRGGLNWSRGVFVTPGSDVVKDTSRIDEGEDKYGWLKQRHKWDWWQRPRSVKQQPQQPRQPRQPRQPWSSGSRRRRRRRRRLVTASGPGDILTEF